MSLFSLTILRKDIHKLVQYRSLGYITLTALTCLITLHYWIIFGNFRQLFVQTLSIFMDFLPLGLQEQIGWAFGCVLFYLIIPAFVIKFVLKHKLFDYGWRAHHYWHSFPLYLVLYCPVLIAILVVSTRLEFQHTYPFYMPTNYTQLIIWEIVYVLQFIGAEFFFRGFILLGVRRYLNNAAAMLAMIFPYTMLHFTKPYMEASASIIAGLILGYLVLRTRSIWGGITVHSMVGVTMDLAALFRHGWFST